MANNALFVLNGVIHVVPLGSNPTNRAKGDLWVDSADGLLIVYDGSNNQKMVTLTTAQTLSNKTLNDTIFTGTVSGLTKSNVGLGNVDNYSAAQLAALTEALTNKTIDGDLNTFLDIPISALKLDAGAPNTFISRDGSGNLISTKAVPTGVVVGTSDSQTLNNKTLTTPIIAQISNTGTLTLPTSTDTLVGRDTTDTLTNKTLTSPTINSGTINTPTVNSPTVTTPVINDYQDINEEAEPSSPSAGKIRLYGKTDKALYYKDSDGNERLLATTEPDTIEMVQLRNFDYSGNFTTLIPQLPWESPTKITDPSSLPTGPVYGTAWSPNGEFLAVAHNTSPYITIYQKTGDSFTKVTNPGTLPTGIAYNCAWSPTGEFLSVVHDTSPYVTIYQRSGSTFTKLTNPGTLPTGLGTGCAWSPNGEFLAVAHNTTPFLTMYKRDGTTFTKLTNPATLPTSSGQCVTFDKTGVRVIVGTSSTGLGPEIQMYSFTTTAVGTRVAHDTPGYTIRSLTMTNDNEYLAACGNEVDILIYDFGGSSLTLDQTLTIPGSAIGKSMFSVQYSLNEKYLVATNIAGDLVYTWSIDANTYTPLSALSGLTLVDGYNAAFSPNNQYLSVVGANSPYINIYRTTGSMPATGLIKLLGI